ncbi:phosphatase PAP2 family protein [Herbivorax sp. ANBcel31]|uniref:phosphatase PAP2 family protein n=1 Tax=Herbivorax sp. ANBcel31 TaxID=3069754 RepID=UPI0027AE02A2|nr:phosphatase PAP2 family protein [Herbivorax sp. ANBcel31]MDQ2087358.1 phosphatase PAP2 family protein [Herbivorax sp. ANBcel31]
MFKNNSIIQFKYWNILMILKPCGEIIMSIDAKIFMYIHKLILKKENLKKPLYFITRASSRFFVVFYAGCVLYLLFNLDKRLIKFLLIPALVFVTVSALRKIINRKRPFEALEIEPIVYHDTGGSFPSRHASSAMIIALSVYWIHPLAGILCIGVAVLTAASRVLAGVHYPLDVLGGIFLSFVFFKLFLI